MNRGLLMSLFAAGVVVAVGCTNRRAAAPPENPPAAVTVAKPLVKTVEQFTDLTGTVAATKAVDLRPRVSGYIEKVMFKDGDEVKAGQPLVLIDPAPFQATLEKAKGDLAKAKATLAQNKSTLGRVESLKAVSQEELDVARSNVQVAAAGVESAQADVKQAELNLGYTTVKAPIDGRIDRIYITEGNLVTGGTSQGTVLTSIVSMNPIYAYFDVDEQTVLYYLHMIKEGKFKSMRETRIPVEAQLRGEAGYPHDGHLDFVSNRLNPGTGSLQIRGEFPNPGPPWILVPGMYVRGRIPLSTAVDAVLVPDEAVTTDQAKKVVYVVDPTNHVVAKPVVLGPVTEGLRVIVSGLSADDRVIIRGLVKVQPGAQVDPKPGKIEPRPQPGVTESSLLRPAAPAAGGQQPGGANPKAPGQSQEQKRPSGAPMGPGTPSKKD